MKKNPDLAHRLTDQELAALEKRITSMGDIKMKKFDGHINLGKCITIYGDNAMHYAAHIWTKRFGHICFRPTTAHGKWKWYFFLSPNATPWAATFAIGPGLREKDKKLAPVRRRLFGHNFDMESRYSELYALNNA